MSEIENFQEEVAEIQKSKFYTYSQNNSGGSFVEDTDRGIGQYVIVEAFDAVQADQLAEDIGLYFDGSGDCECCGNRWYSANNNWYTDLGNDFPQIYDEDVTNGLTTAGFTWDDPEAIGYIHYMSGQRTAIKLRK